MEEIKELPKDEQIEVLRTVKEKLLAGNFERDEGLCTLILRSSKYNRNMGVLSLYQSYPLFTSENAIKHANADCVSTSLTFWWEINPYDVTNRIVFIDWIISELEKQKTE